MAMTCKEVWLEVSEYIDGTLSANARAALDQHLAHCRHCTAIVDGIHNVIVLMTDRRVFALPSGFTARLRARLKREL
jgi:anti-sigma factor RsiW